MWRILLMNFSLNLTPSPTVSGASCNTDPPCLPWLPSSTTGSVLLTEVLKCVWSSSMSPHIPLLEKLSEIGLDPYILRWIKSYLTNREQFVVVDGTSSSPLDVLSGVPQGSVLGPLLFIIYINDVVQQVSDGSKINLFADDIALYRIIYSPSDYDKLQFDINAVSSCLISK